MKKVIAITLATFILLLSFSSQRAEAATNTLNIIKGYTQSNLYYQYGQLTSDQRDICNFLVGCYNMTYLGARGFKFEAGAITNWSKFKVQMQKLGSTVMQYTSANAWASRMSDVFCNFMSSCIVYASQTNSNFDTWYSNLPSDFSIPYSSDMYDAWNNFYNDLSNDGIMSFGSITSNWYSGDFFDFAYSGMPWVSSNFETKYNNFILNYSPVIFSNVSGTSQVMISPNNNNRYIDSLFILKSESSVYSSYMFGYSDISKFDYMAKEMMLTAYNGMIRDAAGPYNIRVYSRIWSGLSFSLSDIISYAFNKTPFYDAVSGDYYFYYPYIEHVFIVDDLNTLSNPVEIYNTDGLNIVGGDPTAKIPVEDLLLHIKRLETDLPFPYPSGQDQDIQTIVVDTSTDSEGNNVTIINNYYDGVIDRVDQAYTDPISFDDNIFTLAGDYVQYLWDNTKPLILYTKDLLEALTIENDDGSKSGLSLAVYAALTIGVAGGIVQKLLL